MTTTTTATTATTQQPPAKRMRPASLSEGDEEFIGSERLDDASTFPVISSSTTTTTTKSAESTANREGEDKAEQNDKINRAAILAKVMQDLQDEDDIHVVIGDEENTVSTAITTMAPVEAGETGEENGGETGEEGEENAGEGGAGKPAAPQHVPTFRFSGSGGSAGGPGGSIVKTNPEIEEALRATGVTPYNYTYKLNPDGLREKRRENAFEIDLDALDHQRWKESNSQLSDFFNYGLNEHTWKEYASKQVALRLYRQQKAQEEAQAKVIEVARASGVVPTNVPTTSSSSFSSAVGVNYATGGGGGYR